jgi:hypothetical protein
MVAGGTNVLARRGKALRARTESDFFLDVAKAAASTRPPISHRRLDSISESYIM